MIRVGIIGGAGYTAGELLRILVYHPEVNLVFVHSKSQAGKKVIDIHRDLIGQIDLIFSNEFDFEIDVLFLCMGHEKSASFLSENKIPERVKIIDLSRDFRLKNNPKSDFIYGLPELNKSEIVASNKIANPGCFATAIQLALLPLAHPKALKNNIHINAITGSTGAGQQPSPTTHFSWRNNNVSIYKPFQHQHLAEIEQSIQQLDKTFNQKIYFIPTRGNFTRGIFASLYLKSPLTLKEAKMIYNKYYESHPFVHMSDNNPDLKQVINTNNCILYLKKVDDQLLIISMIDNLIKGASGQAVQNMNLMFGLPETTALNLKPISF